MGRRTYFHVSPSANREAILAKGLDGASAPDSPWSNFDDYDCGQYLWDDRDVAQDYADELMLDATDIWEVDVNGLNVVADPSITPDTPEFGSKWHPHAERFTTTKHSISPRRGYQPNIISSASSHPHRDNRRLRDL